QCVTHLFLICLPIALRNPVGPACRRLTGTEANSTGCQKEVEDAHTAVSPFHTASPEKRFQRRPSATRRWAGTALRSPRRLERRERIRRHVVSRDPVRAGRTGPVQRDLACRRGARQRGPDRDRTDAGNLRPLSPRRRGPSPSPAAGFWLGPVDTVG